jgi:hypothetical protein
MIEELYTSGGIRLECAVVKCVGFNDDIHRALHAPMPGNLIHPPGRDPPNTKKRPADDSGEHQHKKAKGTHK